MHKPSIGKIDHPYIQAMTQKLVAWRWKCPNHNHKRKGYAHYDYATYDEALAGLKDHISRYHPETHVCPRCGAAHDKLHLEDERLRPRARRSYRCTSCGGYFERFIGPEKPGQHSEWPPGSGQYPWSKS